MAVQDLIDERPTESLVAVTQRLRSDCNANVNHAACDLVRDVLCRCKTRRAEAGNMLCARCIGETGGKGSSTDVVGCFAVSDISKTDIVHKTRVQFASNPDLFQSLEDQGVKRGVFQTAFAGFAHGRSDGECDDYIIGIFLGAVQEK